MTTASPVTPGEDRIRLDRVNGEVLRRAMTDTPRFAAAFATASLSWGMRR